MNSGRIIGLVSGKGGVGKTSLTVNLGVALSELGNEVTLIDTDFSASNIGVHLGRYDHPVKIQDVLDRGSSPKNAIFRHPTGLKAMVSSNEIHQIQPNLNGLSEAVSHAKKESDYVLIDCPPGLNETVEKSMSVSDELLIVTLPTQSSGINAAQIVEKAKKMRKPILGTIVNMVEETPDRELVDREIEMMTESHVMKKIPHDRAVKQSVFDNQPVVKQRPLSEASIEIKELAASLDGQQFERPSFPKIKRGVRKLKETIQN